MGCGGGTGWGVADCLASNAARPGNNELILGFSAGACTGADGSVAIAGGGEYVEGEGILAGWAASESCVT